MKSAFDLADSLRRDIRKTSVLRRCIEKLKRQGTERLEVCKTDIKEIRNVSHFLYSVTTDKCILVSFAFDEHDLDKFLRMDFRSAVFRKVYQDIWYDVELS